MKRPSIWVALALTAFCACGGKEAVPKPEVLLTEQQMIDVLTDAYLIEGDLTQKRTAGKDVSKLQESYYRQLFEHYNLTDTLFKQNMTYYSYHPEMLEIIMDSVANRFEKAK